MTVEGLSIPAFFTCFRMERRAPHTYPGFSDRGLQLLVRTDQKRGFPPICPDFFVELRSPSDRLSGLQAKMREWMANGAKLGWLIDPEARTVYIYRPGQTTERLVDPRRVEGEPRVDSFVLEMAGIWDPDL